MDLKNLHSDKVLSSEITSMKDELEDHLISINENTDELENNYSYLMEIDQRLDLMEKKVNSIYDMLSKLTDKKVIRAPKKVKISETEQDVFMVFYTAERALCYDDLCKKLGKSESFVRYNVNNLITKGVPIMKKKIGNRSYLLLDRAFKELQAKQNILNLSRTLTLDCFDQSIIV